MSRQRDAHKYHKKVSSVSAEPTTRPTNNQLAALYTVAQRAFKTNNQPLLTIIINEIQEAHHE